MQKSFRETVSMPATIRHLSVITISREGSSLKTKVSSKQDKRRAQGTDESAFPYTDKGK